MQLEIVWLVRITQGGKVWYMDMVWNGRAEAQQWVDNGGPPRPGMTYEVVWAIPNMMRDLPPPDKALLQELEAFILRNRHMQLALAVKAKGGVAVSATAEMVARLRDKP